MPSIRYRHIKNLIKSGKAKKVSSKPFTIQLLYESEDGKQQLTLGIDPGRTNIGISVVKDDGTCVLAAQVTTRNKEIPKLMSARKAYRAAHRHFGRRTVRQRRAKAAHTEMSIGILERKLPGCEKPIKCIGIRNKEARFNHRARPEGWLTPTANQLLETHINMVRKIQKILPITSVVLEANRFAFMAMDDANVKRWEYQRGQLYGKGSIEDAVFAAQDGKCLLCGSGIEEYHHLVPRHEGGSNTLPNMVGLCNSCHVRVHTDAQAKKQLTTLKTGINKKYGALSVLNQIIPTLATALGTMFPDGAYATDGQSTKMFRDAHSIAKDHYLDAYCIACSVLSTISVIDDVVTPFQVMQFRRHDRQACHQAMMNRKYYLDGKVVATNRHAAYEQKDPSLADYVAAGGDISKLVVRQHLPHCKNMGRIMPGSIVNFDGKVAVFSSSSGTYRGKPCYYIPVGGNKVSCNKCKFVANNTGLVFA